MEMSYRDPTERQYAYFLKTLKKGIVALEKRCTLIQNSLYLEMQDVEIVVTYNADSYSRFRKCSKTSAYANLPGVLISSKFMTGVNPRTYLCISECSNILP